MVRITTVLLLIKVTCRCMCINKGGSTEMAPYNVVPCPVHAYEILYQIICFATLSFLNNADNPIKYFVKV